MDKCVGDSEKIIKDVKDAIKYFEEETYDGIKNGLYSLGDAIEEIPSVTKDCKNIEADLEKLKDMAKVFEHPFLLIFEVGKNLIVNGVDIYHDISDSITRYRAK